MQTIQVLRTIDWLGVECARFFSLVLKVLESPHGEQTTLLLPIVHEHGRLQPILTVNKDAVEVLKAFELAEGLLSPGRLLTALLLRPDRPPSPGEGMDFLHSKLYVPWSQMMSCVKPLKQLTIPPELAGDSLPEGLITLTFTERETCSVEVLAQTLSQILKLYDAVGRIHTPADLVSLEVVKIESGTSIRIDLKGLGHPIKEIKNLILEMWSKYRHKRTDEVIDHNRAVASSIAILDEIDRNVRKGSITNEDGNRFKRAIVSNTLGLFKNGVLIEEISLIEQVDNAKLLAGFGPKLLTAGEGSDGTPEKESPEQPLQAAIPSAVPEPYRKKKRPKRKKKQTTHPTEDYHPPV